MRDPRSSCQRHRGRKHGSNCLLSEPWFGKLELTRRFYAASTASKLCPRAGPWPTAVGP